MSPPYGELVFDGPVNAAPSYSVSESWARIGRADRLYVEMVASDAAADGDELTVDLECSNDGVGWAFVVNLSIIPLKVGTLEPSSAKIDGSTPLGAQVRIKAYVSIGTKCYLQGVRILCDGVKRHDSRLLRA